MRNWFRRLDEALFSPPHQFETILAFVAARLGLAPEVEESRRAEANEGRKMPTEVPEHRK